MVEKKAGKGGAKKNKKRNQAKEINILESALRVFGEKGFEATTIAAIAREAKISDATIYEYFGSKEEILFSIPELYTRRELARMKEVAHYIHDPREKMRAIIQVYLEFYERNPLYTSVALLTLKGNRNFVNSPAYQTVREASRSIVDAFNAGVAAGLFRDDIDGYLVRNLVLGFIEHLTIQWLVLGRPQGISDYRETIFDMVMGAVEKKEDADRIEVKAIIDGLKID